MITRCNICGGAVRTAFRLKFEDITGMGVHDYTQNIGICDTCGFIFTQNPFDEYKLANRYKNESKFEYDADDYILDQRDEYARRCARQKNFIDDATEGNYESVFEVGASSGYNLSLYKGKGLFGVEPSKLNCHLAKRRYGIDIFNGTYQEYFAGGHRQKVRFSISINDTGTYRQSV